MFKPKKAIPALAASVLALAGCGSSDGNAGGSSGAGGSAGTGGTAGTGGSPSDGLANALSAFCMKAVECFPNDYGSVQECEDEITQYYALGAGITPECEAAAISYFDCATALSCAELDMESNDCDAESNAADQACGL